MTKRSFLLATILTLLTSVCASTTNQHVDIAGSDSYEYYGYMPSFNYTCGLDVIPQPSADDPHPGWHINGTGYLDILGINDTTSVSIYDIRDPDSPILLASNTVDRMQLWSYRMPKETYFKVVSDKPVAASIGGGSTYGSEARASIGSRSDISYGTSLFYPSADEGFAGKEFIFLAQPSGKYAEQPEPPHHIIHAIEDAHVTIYDDQGRIIFGRDIPANNSRGGLGLAERRVYRVVSTGRIMIANWVGNSFTVLPSTTGGWIGKRFFMRESHGAEQVVLLIVAQEEPTHVKVLDPTAQIFVEMDLQARGMWMDGSDKYPWGGENTMIMSEQDAMVFAGNANRTATGTNALSSMRDSVTFFGVEANQPATFYVISEAVIFSPGENARVNVGPLAIDVKKGHYARLPAGLITIDSNATLIMETITNYRPAVYWSGASESFAAYLITSRAVDVAYTAPASREEAGTPITIYIAAGLAAAIVVVTSLVIKKRKVIFALL